MLKRLVVLVALPVLGIGCAFWAGASWERNKDIPFNQMFWSVASINQTIGGDVDPMRHRMVNDLLKKYLSPGNMNRSQVIALLGEPAEGHSKKSEISYWLNEEYGWGIDPVKVEYLTIQFDSRGLVARCTHNVYRR